MTGQRTSLNDPDVDYITGGPDQDESKFYQRLGRQRRESMGNFSTQVPEELLATVRETSRATGESIVDMTTRALRRVLADDVERGIAVAPRERGLDELREPVIRQRGRTSQLGTRIPHDLYEQVRERCDLTAETVADLTSRGFTLILTGERKTMRRKDRTPKVPFVTYLPASTLRRVREHCQQTGETLSSFTERAVTYMLANSRDPREDR